MSLPDFSNTAPTVALRAGEGERENKYFQLRKIRAMEGRNRCSFLEKTAFGLSMQGGTGFWQWGCTGNAFWKKTGSVCKNIEMKSEYFLIRKLGRVRKVG